MTHCLPKTAQGSGDCFAYSHPDHRHNDLRDCGGQTVVIGQSTVFVNSRLWSVKNDPDNHINGQLINTGTTVFIASKPVIVHSPDPALPDNLCGVPDDGGGGGGGGGGQ